MFGLSIIRVCPESAISLTSGLLNDFSISDLKEVLDYGEFDNHFEYVSSRAKFIYHTLPILASLPGHVARKPREIWKSLKRSK